MSLQDLYAQRDHLLARQALLLEALDAAEEALTDISLAGMSLPAEASTRDSLESFQARQAWKFIGIATRGHQAVQQRIRQVSENEEKPPADLATDLAPELANANVELRWKKDHKPL